MDCGWSGSHLVFVLVCGGECGTCGYVYGGFESIVVMKCMRYGVCVFALQSYVVGVVH